MNNKRVLVTGASRGIGRSIAGQLAKDGFAVTVHYRSGAEQAQDVVSTINNDAGNATLLQFDITERGEVQQAVANDIEKNGPFYGVVCNAGITRDNAFPMLSDEDWDQVIHTNLDGFYNILKPIVMPMVQNRQGGRIVAISSVSGIMGNRGQVNYSASKAGLIGAVKALALELAKRKITVNCVAPGLIETDMVNEEIVSEAMKFIPVKRMGKPAEVASLVAYLFSDQAAYITRQVISVNGGMA